jgi:aminoglycoside phosphotransferase (APT) family kinase protein
VTLDQSHRAGCTVPGNQVEQVRQWIENYRRVKENLEKISDINRELVLRLKKKAKKRKSAEK